MKAALNNHIVFKHSLGHRQAAKPSTTYVVVNGGGDYDGKHDITSITAKMVCDEWKTTQIICSKCRKLKSKAPQNYDSQKKFSTHKIIKNFKKSLVDRSIHRPRKKPLVGFLPSLFSFSWKNMI